jgi:hypothetical protein
MTSRWRTPLLTDITPPPVLTEEQRAHIRDLSFIRGRLAALDPAAKLDHAAVEDTFRRAVIELLRGGTPSRYILDYAAAELETLWHPETEKDRRKRNREAADLASIADQIDYYAAEYKERGKRAPRTLAKQKVAEMRGVKVESLKTTGTRYRRRARASAK